MGMTEHTNAFSDKKHPPVIPAHAGIQKGQVAMTDRLAITKPRVSEKWRECCLEES